MGLLVLNNKETMALLLYNCKCEYYYRLRVAIATPFCRQYVLLGKGLRKAVLTKSRPS